MPTTHSPRSDRPLKFGITLTPSGYQYPLPGGGYGIRATYVQALWAMARSAPDALARELEAEALAAAEDADLNV